MSPDTPDRNGEGADAAADPLYTQIYDLLTGLVDNHDEVLRLHGKSGEVIREIDYDSYFWELTNTVQALGVVYAVGLGQDYNWSKKRLMTLAATATHQSVSRSES